MAFEIRADLAQLQQLGAIEGAGLGPRGVQDRRGVALRQHEAIAVRIAADPSDRSASRRRTAPPRDRPPSSSSSDGRCRLPTWSGPSRSAAAWRCSSERESSDARSMVIRCARFYCSAVTVHAARGRRSAASRRPSRSRVRRLSARECVSASRAIVGAGRDDRGADDSRRRRAARRAGRTREPPRTGHREIGFRVRTTARDPRSRSSSSASIEYGSRPVSSYASAAPTRRARDRRVTRARTPPRSRTSPSPGR